MSWPAPGRGAPAGPPPLPAGWAAYAPGAPRPVTPPRVTPLAPPPARSAPVGAPAPAAVPTGPSWSFAELEERLTGRLLAYVGGIAVLLGAVLFLSLAFTRGWIDPAGRVAIGLVGATVVFGLGAWLFETRPGQNILATVLVGVGLGVGTVSIVGATRLYDLVPVELGLIGSLVLGLAAATVAIRVDSRVVGIFGLLAVLGAPPAARRDPGTGRVRARGDHPRRHDDRRPSAFVALVPRARLRPVGAAARRAGSPATPRSHSGLAALAGFWLINAIAAGGEELLRPTDRLRDTSATLIVADAAYLVWGGFVLLDGPAAPWRALFLVGVALAHAVTGRRPAWCARATAIRSSSWSPAPGWPP